MVSPCGYLAALKNQFLILTGFVTFWLPFAMPTMHSRAEEEMTYVLFRTVGRSRAVLQKHIT